MFCPPPKSFFLLLGLLLAIATPAAAAPGIIERSGYVGVSLDPLLYESNIYQSAYAESLDRLFAERTTSFAEGIAAGLEKSSLAGPLHPIPGYRLERQADFRARGIADTFLVTIDLRSGYGLSEKSSLATCLSPASCFILSSVDMLVFNCRTEATVNAFYFPPGGERLRLVEKRFQAKASVAGDFFDAMDMAQELERINLLTGMTLDELERKILAALPDELLRQAWAEAGDALRHPAQESEPPAAALQATAPPCAATTLAALAPQPAAGRGGALDLQELARRSSPAIFHIRTPVATGSGFVLSRRGYGVTSLHVVEDAERIAIRFHNGTELTAKLVAAEPRLDLAVLAFVGTGLTPLPLGDSARLAGGEQLVAIGYPLESGLSVMPGTVSSLAPYRGTPLIHLDAPLAPGNSGAPLLNRWGEGVGIVFRRTLGGEEATVLGIPMHAAKPFLQPYIDPL